MKPTLVSFSIAALLLFSSCHFNQERVRGNGNVTTQNRNTAVFHSLDISGAVDVYIKQDSISSVRIETDDNLIGYIKTESDGSTLRIFTQDGINLSATHNVKVYVSGPTYSHIDVSGASNVYGETKVTNTGKIGLHATGASSIKLDLDAPAIDAELTGASDISLTGTTKTFTANGTGASGLKSFGLMTESADVDMSGASSAEVFASVKLEADASGASHIKYKGNASVTQNVSGAGSISRSN